LINFQKVSAVVGFLFFAHSQGPWKLFFCVDS